MSAPLAVDSTVPSAAGTIGEIVAQIPADGGQIGDEFISLTFHESEGDDSEDEESAEDESDEEDEEVEPVDFSNQDTLGNIRDLLAECQEFRTQGSSHWENYNFSSYATTPNTRAD